VTDTYRAQAPPIRIVRVIARLNIGGPAIQAITLTKRLEPLGYRTTLVRGMEEPDEGNMDHLADELGVTPVLVPSLRRNPGWHDLSALWALVRIMRRERPHIVHTHAAKGGTLGRLATVIAFPLKSRRPVVIHTYHGHSLTGYFSSRTAAIYRRIEQVLALFTDRLIAVSDEVRDELVGMGIAPETKFAVVPLGFDLSPFQIAEPERTRERERVRSELGIPLDARVLTLVARLVPIKRVDRFLRIASKIRDTPHVRFLIVGDGELRESLHSSPEALVLGSQLTWAGFRKDMPAVYFASDVVALTSDNEGTPVSLIEAQAASLPVVSTRVGGVASVVADGETGFVLGSADEAGFAMAIQRLLSKPQLTDGFAAKSSLRATQFGLEKLVMNVTYLYRGAARARREPIL
jgi:glycosyltransferase involved in cell wall biosynthesis